VQITAKNFNFAGQISAAGNIAADLIGICNINEGICVNGGSGGSVLLNYTSLSLEPTSLITVAGGPYSVKDGGGGGGRVAVYGPSGYPGRVIVSGGTSSSQSVCLTGGAGTLYIDSVKALVVNNERLVTQSPTIISSNSSVALKISFSAIAVPDNSAGVLNFSSISLNGGQLNPNLRLSLAQNKLSLLANSLQLIEGSLIGGADLETLLISLEGDIEVDASSGMYFVLSMLLNAINCNINGDLRGSINLLQSSSKLLMQAKNSVTISSESSIKADRIVVLANSTFISGNLHSPDTVCNTDINDNSNPPFVGLQDDMIFTPLQPPLMMVTTYNFTVYIYGNQQVNVFNTGRIGGARIGMCSKHVEVSGVISAMGQGCSSNQGPGRGTLIADVCSGTGGGYGGKGGRGKNDSKNKCGVGGTYSSERAPWYEGSGGGSLTSSGGEGGGYIQVESINMTVNGIISADGQDAILNASGGGSGGGMYLKLMTLSGTSSGQIRANGHPGNLGGGGGGGGRILISWLGYAITSNTTTNYTSILQNTDNWSGRILASGSLGSNGGEDGEDGTVNSQSCQAGYYGYLCDACPKGKYSDDLSSATCKACKHIDNDGTYTEEASTDNDCTFDCPKGYTKDTQGRSCYSPVNEFMRLFGGQNYFTMYMLLTSCLTGLAAVFFYYLYRRKRRLTRGARSNRSHLLHSNKTTKTRRVPM
jgi:hypothetical protein